MKLVLRILKWLLISVFGLVALLFFLLILDRDYQKVTLTQEDLATINPQRSYDPEIVANSYDSLMEKFGKNKVLAEGFELQCLLALSHYPELVEVPIEFRVQATFLPLSSRPEPISILFPWIKRNYLIVISDQSEDFFEPILLKNTPFNEQIGIIGHELAHTVYYLDKSALQLAQIAYKYQDNDFITPFERDTDKRAIAHGLGYQMYEFAFFVRRAFGDTPEEIASEEGETYLSPKEIAREMKKYDFYKYPLE